MRLAEILSAERIRTGVALTSKQEALRTIAGLLAEGGAVPADKLLQVLLEREELASTGVGSGVAIPHGRMPELDALRAALLVSPGGVPFEAVDGEPVQIVVGVLAPQHHTGDHLKVLARISRLLRSAEVREQLIGAADAAAALAVVAAGDASL